MCVVSSLLTRQGDDGVGIDRLMVGISCQDCLSACWLLAIKEGSIENVACPSIECVRKRAKREAAVRPMDTLNVEVKVDDGIAPKAEREREGEKVDEVELELVEKVVGRLMSERLRWLREKRRVENGKPSITDVSDASSSYRIGCADPLYTTCPLQHCQSPVPGPPPLKLPTSLPESSFKHVFRLGTPKSDDPAADAEKEKERRERELEAYRRGEEDKWERYRQCPGCQFSFCRYCNTTW